MANSGEGRIETVVIALQDGIELVIVTASAAQRQPEEGLPGGVDDFIQRVRAGLGCLYCILIANVVVRASYQKG